ncbi:enoyl-CoA hydratase/isomerase family protein (plasmid) [Azospirillum oryzae]|uniref:Enoyl-CoA hydratase/isomerase family protein n=1 Tax=Azospirillum oryzae TaxID=286727 RepID=A0A6N1AQQ6_9PROT|nr:enoyl-CoA hydratase/isomerase family protein [Azospirillum oryzae]KAA0587850.1 enoyl-CoA hydratase/isomerase family protein [Azospirillum oryzae]QKS53966.1 enoyl-CoA hydratase/isomerase family protein [Azospirillum oryzae]GLR77765.1 enoyl-CoA hydratase [Azospirillum oryzae]
MTGEPAGGVVVERRGGVAVIRLAAPPLNLLTQPLRRAITDAVAAVDEADDVRAAVLTGGDCFCAGADLKEFGVRRDPDVARDHCRNGHRMTLRLVACAKPVVAAVEGACLGGGFELALACDLRVVASDARLGLPEVARGTFPGTGGLYLLRRLAGPARAKRLAGTGMIVTADASVMAEVVDQVTPPGGALDAALALAATLAERPAGAVQAVKRLVDHDLAAGLRDYLDAEERDYVARYRTRDAEEGWNAFLEKRSPAWTHN